MRLPIVVDMGPATLSMETTASHQFTATATNAIDPSITWSIQSGGGTISASGLYTAPGTTGTATIRATSVEDPTKYDEVVVTVALPVAAVVSVSPAVVTLPRSAPRNFRATVSGAANTAVTWSIQLGGGTVSPHGRLLTPNADGLVVLRATSVADPSKYAEAQVVILGVVETGLTGPMDAPYPPWNKTGWAGYDPADYISPRLGNIDFLPAHESESPLASLVTPVRDLPVSPYSDAIMEVFQSGQRWDGFDVGARNFASMEDAGMAMNVVRSSETPSVSVTFEGTKSGVDPIHSDPGPWPIPPTARIQGFCYPYSPTAESISEDRHLVLIDLDNWNCYEAFRAHKHPDSNDWSVYNGWVYNLVTGHWAPGVDASDPRYVPPGQHRFPAVLVNAAALPMLPLTVRYEEIYEHAEIRHKIGFTLDNNKIGGTWVWPAQAMSYDNRNRYNSGYGPTVPYGATLRLKESWYRANVEAVDGTPLGTWGPGARVVLRAYYEYGIILTDGGYNGDIWVLPDSRLITENRWENDLRYLSNCKLSAFEVVDFEDDLIDVTVTPDVAAQGVERTVSVTCNLWDRHPNAHPGNPSILSGSSRPWAYNVSLMSSAGNNSTYIGVPAAGETVAPGYGGVRGQMSPDHPTVTFKYTPNFENPHIYPFTDPVGIPFPYHAQHPYVVKTNEATLPITVSVSPNPATIPAGGTQQFTATTIGTNASLMVWQSSFPTTGAPNFTKPLSGSGLFTDLGTGVSGTVSVRPTTNQRVTGSAAVEVTPPPPGLSRRLRAILAMAGRI